MKLQQLLTFASMVATIAVTSGHIGGDMSIQDIKPSIYCGRRLADVLAALCAYKENKRGPSGYYMSNAIPAYYDGQEEMNWPWLAPHKARMISLPSRGKRDNINIISECCDKACTVDELMTYC